MEPPGPGPKLGADAGGEGPDVAAQHPPGLSEQPAAEAVTAIGGLGNLPGESGELGLAEVVVAVSQQTKPEE